MSVYLMIVPTEDGLTVDSVTKDEVNKRLSEEYYGPRKWLTASEFAAISSYAFENGSAYAGMDSEPGVGIIVQGSFITPSVKLSI